MLSKLDDYPVHPTPEPLARPATSDRNVYDRYWFNGYDREGGFYFGIGLALYPNLRIMDCGFSFVRDGEQHAFHASRRAPLEPTETEVGPFRIEVIQPMRQLRVVLAPNETGISCDLRFGARSACVEEGRQILERGGRRIMDATRFAQFGSWQGELSCPGQRVVIDGERVLGTRDRSWGVRPVGDPAPPGAPPSEPPQIFFLWAPLHWEDHCSHYLVFEDGDGIPEHQEGMWLRAYEDPNRIPGVEDPETRPLHSLAHELVYEPGTRRVRSARITMSGQDGQPREVELAPLLCFHMKGIGYSHPEWGHGRWKGELALGGESWKTAELDPLALENLHVQQVVRARCDGREGVGVLEQLCLGRHARSGFRSLLDGAA